MDSGNPRLVGKIPIIFSSVSSRELCDHIFLEQRLMNRYTIKSQLPPAIAATATAIQFATGGKTTMVFLYM
jgi:hypothetical protein